MAHFDHLVISVPDLDAAAKRWAAAGLTPGAGGEHPGGTRNILIRGPEPAYVELITAPPEADNHWAERVRATAGPLGFAVAVSDIDGAREALLSAGFAPEPVRHGARTTPDGVELSWRLCDVGERPFDPELPFLIQWLEPMPGGPADGPALTQLKVRVPEPQRLERFFATVGFFDERVRLEVEEGPAGILAVSFRAEQLDLQSEHQLDGLVVRVN